jgi:hypothetical protein
MKSRIGESQEAIYTICMNLTLAHNYTYILFAPLEEVRNQLRSITKTPWYDLAVNISGKIADNNSFILYPKFSLSIEVFSMPQSVAILTGQLQAQDKEQTVLLVEVRPNHAVLIVFYLLVFGFVLNLANVFLYSTEVRWIITVILFILVMNFRSLIQFSIYRLRNRFERIMSIHPEE